jgi:hypothetical protein
MEKWQTEKVAINDIAIWADNSVAKEWGKKAAARVFHICDAGKDIEIPPFAVSDISFTTPHQNWKLNG